MNKYRIIALIIALILISTGSVIITTQGLTLKKQIKTNANKEIYLGFATISGDGTKQNTTVDAIAENDLVIKTESETSLVDFYISYNMECSGSTDSGAVSLLVQINQQNKGNNQTATIDFKTGELYVRDVEVSWRDVLTFEISAAYTNGVPAFVIPDLAVGGGVVSKKARSFDFQENILNRFFVFERLKSIIYDLFQ
jgi:hypothetical protein